MAYTNQEVAEYLQNIATAYEIKNKNRFRIVAYENAAEIAQCYPDSIFETWQRDPILLDNIPHFGSAICQKVDYLFTHRQPHPTVSKIFATLHPAIFTFTKINGIGPKIAYTLTKNFKFSKKPLLALDQLVRYARGHKIKNLPNFGERSENLILDNTLAFLGRRRRMMQSDAQKLSTKLVNYLHSKFPKYQFIPLGSLRRLSPTVGDIDIAVAASDSSEIIKHFLKFPLSTQILSQGNDKASIRLLHDVRVDLMVKPAASFGALLQHFTGSKQHNIILRRHALKLGYSLSEYGIKDLKTGKIYKFTTEEKFYNFLGLKYIPPPERVGENELEQYRK